MISRTNEIVIGILRHYSRLYFGVSDVTMNVDFAEGGAVEIELDAGVDDDEDSARKLFLDDVDSDDDEVGWKPALHAEQWRWSRVALGMVASLLFVGVLWIVLELLHVVPEGAPAHVTGDQGAKAGKGEAKQAESATAFLLVKRVRDGEQLQQEM